MSVFKRWNGTSWETIGPQISSTRFDDTNHMIAPEYSSTSTYNVGDYVVQSDKLYKCISAIESAEEWTAAHWTQVSMGGEVSDLNSAIDNTTISDNLTNSFTLFGYVILNVGVGNTVSTIPINSQSFNYIIVPCAKGDRFVITGTGGNASRLWGITDKDYKLIDAESANFRREEKTINISNDGYFIANVNTSESYSLVHYHYFNAASVEKIKGEIAVIKNNLMVTDDFSDDYVTNSYINLSGSIGSTVNTTPISSNTVNHIIFRVSKGDIIVLTGTGGSSSRLFGITDNNYKLLFVDIENSTRTNYTITINQDGYFISNVMNAAVYLCTFTHLLDVDTITEVKNGLIALDGRTSAFEERTILDMLALESGGLRYSDGTEADNIARVRTQGRIYQTTALKCPAEVVVLAAFYYLTSDDSFQSYVAINANSTIITPPTGCYARVVFSKSNGTSDISPDDLIGIDAITQINNRVNAIEQGFGASGMAEYTYDHDMYDCSAIVSAKQYIGGTQALEKIYSYFDELVLAHGDYVTKSDIAEELQLAYPIYANGVSGSAIYQDTPAYKTYIYKFVSSNPHVNTAYQKKGKILIIGATHGSENAAPFNMYILGKRLCEDFLADPNIFGLKSAFDVYMIPCLNGYGMYHDQRTNANGVDINRNYPIHAWAESGAGTDHYTGATAGSEFETQIVIGTINSLKPDLLVDHHNYYNLAWQFYTELNNPMQLKESYRAASDCSLAFKKNLPEYFGTDYDFVIQRTGGSVPGQLPDPTWGTTSRYGYEKGVPFSCTIEISYGINFYGGEIVTTSLDQFGSNAFSVAEYTLRNQLLHYTDWIMRNPLG